MRIESTLACALGAAVVSCAASTPPAAAPALSQEQVADTTAKNNPALNKACAKAAGPSGANVTLTIAVESDGSVSSVASKGSDAALNACVEGQARTWKFPATSGKSTVDLPFHFAANSAPEATGPVDPMAAAASAALGTIDVRPCKAPGGPTGTGHVKITFAPSGDAISSEVDAPPFAGTDVGRCIAEKYRTLHIAPYTGKNVQVGKTFQLE
jgi:hypothetical protein